MSISTELRIQKLAESLNKEAVENPTPDTEKCRNLVEAISKESDNLNVDILQKTKIGKFMTKSIKSFKRHKRTEETEAVKEWDSIIQYADALLKEWKAKAENEGKSKSKVSSPTNSNKPGPPATVAEYRTRLLKAKKELFKDPPVLPPTTISIESKKCPAPKRNKENGHLSFVTNDSDVKDMLKDFKPNRTPEEVLRAGSFGGTYFRPITSAVTNITYNAKDVIENTLQDEWTKGLPINMLTSKTYRPQINKFGVKCGGSLGMWESSGWIVDSDPYGWFQWYCRFYQGRRCSDDRRQISRWLKSAGPKGRFRSQLCNKILGARTTHGDTKISPVIRQTLLHWGLEITPIVLAAHRKRVGA